MSDPEQNGPVSTRKSADAPKLLTTLDSTIKFLAGAAGVVAAMGLPAVYLHLSRFGLPPTLIFSGEILKAGLLPAAALALVFIYLLFAIKTLRLGGWPIFILIHGLLLLPIVALTLLIASAGIVCGVILYLWGLLWVITWFAHLFLSFEIPSRLLLVVATVLTAFGVLVFAALRATYKFWEERPGFPWTLARRLRKSRLQAPPGDKTPDKSDLVPHERPVSEPPAHTDSQESSGKLLLVVSLILPFFYALCVYGLKGVVHIWSPEISAWLTHGRLVLFACVSALLYSAFMAAVALTDHEGQPRKPRAGPVIVTVVVSVLYLIAVGVYSISLYPHVPLGLGGGKPAPVELWLNTDKPSDDLSSVLTKATFTKVKELIEITNVFILYSDGNQLLLIDSPEPPASAVLVNKERFVSMSW